MTVEMCQTFSDDNTEVKSTEIARTTYIFGKTEDSLFIINSYH